MASKDPSSALSALVPTAPRERVTPSRRQARANSREQYCTIDPQNAKGADTVGRGSRGYDAGNKIHGRKRFTTDITGLLITVAVMAASWQDRDGAKTTLPSAYLTTRIRHLFADRGFARRLVDWARDTLRTTLEIVCKPADQCDFDVISRWWVVERTLCRPG
ncbi:transposase [Nonomuraea sp. KM90]|uniref:transposase n=1 Tax=Nonomuraea sp. KM90 TaxID=3457428 RepID=UPI003FCDF9F6